MFFWRKNPFGFILSAGNEQDPNLFVLSYSDYKSQDTSFIELTYADRPSIISIPILDKNQGWGKWKNIKLYFEKENDLKYVRLCGGCGKICIDRHLERQ